MALAAARIDRTSIDQAHRKSVAALSPPSSPTFRAQGGSSIATHDFLSPSSAAAPTFPQKRATRIQFDRIESFVQSNREEDEATTETPENYILRQSHDDSTLKLRPRSMSHHLESTKVPSRRWLKIQAAILRSLMSFAVHILPKVRAPKPPKPSFIRKIHPAPSGSKPIELYFYTPPTYMRSRSEGRKLPLLVDFHGGGFCLGHPADDAHWARIAMQSTSAVVVSVGYRLAPDHPFPGPVDDSVDALLWLSANADYYGLDTSRTVLSGFSAGANLAFTVPLRLEFFTKQRPHMSSVPPTLASDLRRWPSTENLLQEPHACDLKIVGIVAWYPLLDWTQSRASKKRQSRNPKKTLPKLFTDLFDYSYLPPPDIHGYHCSPYASPALAPDHMIQTALPKHIQLWLCEWDMLLAEGEVFARRLADMGKQVKQEMIQAVPHGFDQSPDPFRDQARIDGLYERACEGLRELWGLEAHSSSSSSRCEDGGEW